MVIKKLNPEDMTTQELLKELLKNQNEADRMRKEIEKFEALELNEIINEINNENKKEEISKKAEKEIITKAEDDEELDYYYEDLRSINNSNNIYTEIKEVLPSRKNYRYIELLTKLKLRLLKEIREIEMYIKEDEFDKESLEEWREFIHLNRQKISIITSISNEKVDKNNPEEEVENNLIFTNTPGGNIRAISEIEHIDPAYYEKFYGLFKSIKDGTFKRVKHFHSSNSKISGVREVRDHKVRVVFDRLSSYNYAIIAVFTKKSDNDRGYCKGLEDKISKFRVQREQMLNGLDNPDYIELNKHYEKELFNKLGVDNKSSKQHIKRGDKNE